MPERRDDKIEALQEERQRYESLLGKLLTAADAGNKPQTAELLSELDDWRDAFGRKIDGARNEMRRLAQPGSALQCGQPAALERHLRATPAVAHCSSRSKGRS